MNTTIFELLLGFIGGGGLVSLVTMPSIIKKARAESETSIMNNYSKFVEEIRKEQTETRARLDVVEELNKMQYEIIMQAFGCSLPKEPTSCPVQEGYKKMKKK